MKNVWFYATLVLSVAVIILLCLLLWPAGNTAELPQETELAPEDSLRASGTELGQYAEGEGYAIDISLAAALAEAESSQLSRNEREQILAAHTQLWKEKIDYYEAAIATYAERYADYHTGEHSDAFAEDYAQSKADWEAYFQAEMDNAQALFTDIYGAGSASGSAMLRTEYELYKERAISLYRFCTNYLISVPIEEEWAP